MHKILFICGANRCRSQIAEAFFNKFSENMFWHAFSAGTKDIAEGKKLYECDSGPYVVKCMMDFNFNLTKNLTKQITLEMARKADKIIVMAEPEICPAYLVNNPKVIFWDVRNPKVIYADICLVRDQIKSLVINLIKELKNKSPN